MTAPAPSTVKAAVAYLVTQAKATIAKDGQHTLYVGYGDPMGEGDPDDQVYLADIDADAELLAMRTPTTPNPMGEWFSIPFQISSFRSNDDGKKAFERCVDLVNAVVAIARTDPTLGGAVLNAYPRRVVYPSPEETGNGQGRIAETEITIDVLGTN